MAVVKIMSGLPGSGKSTLIKQNYTPLGKPAVKDVVVFSADNFFMVNGVYRFDRSRLADAHDKCLGDFIRAAQSLNGGSKTLIVDNTNVSAMEIAPYYRISQVFGHQVEVIRLICDPIIAFKRNVHEVPLRTIMDMHTKMQEPLLAWWNVRYEASS